MAEVATVHLRAGMQPPQDFLDALARRMPG
jgi:hypothetical protein